ncbi:MAG: diacylglycerol kinase family lipid kinase [Deltaproteobacteria bacterium]|nr:diacylglycerol kinase family lipid kinase [Deltaproteobacteria bacterium]MBW2253546.1 diacylglycerol kinase family lipid kinase [Deltaproteobacteria bacterium]
MSERNETERLCLIVNPLSGGGATERRLEKLRRAADRWFAEWTLRITEGPGHATELAAEAVSEGFQVVAAVGGDGTASETVNGLFEEDRIRDADVVFTAIPAGTGSDLVRTLDVPRDFGAALRVAAEGETRASDVAHVVYTPPGTDETEGRICVNVAGFGLSGDVVLRANQSSKRFGGTATFLSASIRSLAAYRPARARVTWVGEDETEQTWEGELMNAFVANGAYCGGGMWVGRGGSMQDGLLDLVLIPRLPLHRALVNFPRLYMGTTERTPGVMHHRIVSLEAEAEGDAPVLLDVDGEQPGALPIRVRVLKSVLKIRGQWGIHE